MRFASYVSGQAAGYGAVFGDAVVPLATPQAATLRLALDHIGIRALVARAHEARASGTALRLADVALLQPIPDPDKILCVGLNYLKHAEEAKMEVPRHPSLFVRFAGSQVAHGEPVWRPRASTQFDYEAELAVVIGARGRAIPEARALDHVAGFACFAENSVRDFQRHATQATAGKNFARSGAFGPWLVTPDEAGPLEQLEVVGRLNGREVQRDSVAHLIFPVQAVIAYVSRFTELLPGDVIVTGTPAGVGFSKTPPLWLVAGDVFEVDIGPVGVLRNPVVDEPLQ